MYVKDVEAKEKLLPVALETIANPEKLQDLSKNIAKLALPDSATIIAKEVLKSLSPCPSPVGRGNRYTAIVLFIISYFWKKSLKKKFEYE